MLKVEGLDKLQKGINQVADTIRKAARLDSFAESPELPVIFGEAIQRTIDRQKFKKLDAKYQIIRDKKFGKKPILKLTESLYNRAKLNSFTQITTGNNLRTVNIQIVDTIATYQQRLGRKLFVPDEIVRTKLFNLAKEEIQKNVEKEFKINK